MMKTPMTALTLLGAMTATLALASVASAADNWTVSTMRPLMATSLDAGGAHVVSYFQKADGACRLTMMMADDTARPAPARIQLSVGPGRTARVDDADGKSSLFTCLGAAEGMVVLRADRLASN